MSLTELEGMGFGRDYLYEMAHRRGQTYCTRTSDKRKAKFLFDTAAFEKERMKLLAK